MNGGTSVIFAVGVLPGRHHKGRHRCRVQQRRKLLRVRASRAGRQRGQGRHPEAAVQVGAIEAADVRVASSGI